MTEPTSPPLSETWSRAIRELERRLAIADTDERSGPSFESVRNLCLLVDLTRQIAATPHGHFHRAGTPLRETLLISTAFQSGERRPEDSYKRFNVVSIVRRLRRWSGGNLEADQRFCDALTAENSMSAWFALKVQQQALLTSRLLCDILSLRCRN